VLAEIRDEIIAKIAEKFVPVYGQVKLIIEALDVLNQGTDIAEAWYHIHNLDTKYEFRITWGLRLLKMSPGLIDKDAS